MVFMRLFCVLLAMVWSFPVFAQVTIHGSTSFAHSVFENPAVDTSQIKINYKIYPTSSGRGLLALHEGRADMAMISADINILADNLKQKNPAFDVNDYVVHDVSETKVLFVVHPDNPIKEITKAQLKSILSGEVEMWSEIDQNSPFKDIRLITEHPTGGMYNVIKSETLKNQDFTEGKTIMQNAPQVAIVVAQLPEAFGFLAESLSDNLKQRIKTVSITDAKQSTLKIALVTKKNDERKHISDFIQNIKSLVP